MRLISITACDLQVSMARRVRLQDAGNLYHVINRGNYRRDVFETQGAKEAFETTLAEVSVRYRWEVHAYVVSELREQKEARWTAILARELARRRYKSGNASGSPASAPWKREVALVLRIEGGAPYRWITERLEMGSPAAARVAVHRFSRECNL